MATKKTSTSSKSAASKPKAAAAKKAAPAKQAAPAKKAAPKKPAASRRKAPAARSKVERIAIVDGARTPFARSWTTLNDVDPVSLSTQVARELLFRNELDLTQLDEIIWGTVIAVPAAPNVAREVALNLGLYRLPGFTVSRACATGFQSVASGVEKILAGQADVILAGGVDVTSHAPVTYKKDVIDTLQKAQKAKGFGLVQTIAQLNPLDLLPTPPALTERYTGLTMGQHAELMAQNFEIAREDQDTLAMDSHKKASAAVAAGLVEDEVITVQTPKGPTREDNLIRDKINPEKIRSLRPVFDRKHGTITAASSSALTDGAACVLLMRESKAKELGYTPKAFVRSYEFAALDGRVNLLLGNVYSAPGALDRAGCTLDDIDIVEVHEAFAAQVLANLKLFDSDSFFSEHLGRSKSIGAVDPDKLNVWGGSIAYGHPFAATGGRILAQLSDILIERDANLGLATACAAGGLGVTMILERA